jgi:hypothetical protein
MRSQESHPGAHNVSQLVVRGCKVTNLTLKSLGLFGAVNSTFDPPLDPSQAVHPNPGCGTVVAGEALCDPRALCVTRKGGGVECACAGKGLKDEEGSHPDGRYCSQDTQIQMLAQTESFTLQLRKPSRVASNSSKRVEIVLQAQGESALRVGYTMHVAQSSADKEAWSRSNASLEWSFAFLENSTFSFGGFRMTFDRPPSNDAVLDLDKALQRFSAKTTFLLDLSADCHGESPCIEDGDAFHVGVTGIVDTLRSAVSITAVVESLLSCERSTLWLEPDAEIVPTSSQVRIRLKAYDVDGLPIRQTRVDVEFRFGGQALPVQWSRGSNEYIADALPTLTEKEGDYELAVRAVNAWSNASTTATSCNLLRSTIFVRSQSINQWTLVGACSASAVFAAALGFWLSRKSVRERLRLILAMVLTEFCKLLIATCFELGDLATDCYTTYRVVLEDGFVQNRIYRIAYAVFGSTTIIGGLVSIVLKVMHAHNLRSRLQKVLSNGELDEVSGVVAKLRWELSKVSRDLRNNMVTILMMLAEDCPMVIVPVIQPFVSIVCSKKCNQELGW